MLLLITEIYTYIEVHEKCVSSLLPSELESLELHTGYRWAGFWPPSSQWPLHPLHPAIL